MGKVNKEGKREREKRRMGDRERGGREKKKKTQKNPPKTNKNKKKKDQFASIPAWQKEKQPKNTTSRDCSNNQNLYKSHKF